MNSWESGDGIPRGYPPPYGVTPRGPSLRLVILLLLVVVMAMVYSWQQYRRTGVLRDRDAESRPVTPRGNLTDEEKSNIDLFRVASGSVVYVTTGVRRRDAFSLNMMEIPRGTGSGFIWDDQGHIVTNFHVIEGSNVVTVTLANRSQYSAKFVGASPDDDLAVLTIDAPREQLKPILIGVSKDLQVGQRVFAIGNPFGLDQTLTTGIVSALGRQIQAMTGRVIEDVVQTDAAINPGNSGGPLLDSEGRLIGVNTAIASPSGVSAGVGFAVPVDTVNRVVPEIIRNGRIVRPVMGVSLVRDNVTHGQLKLKGVLIAKVLPGGPAAKAGMRGISQDEAGEMVLGDLIVAIDGKAVQSIDDLQRILASHKVGDVVVVTAVRDDQRKEYRVQLKAEG